MKGVRLITVLGLLGLLLATCAATFEVPKYRIRLAHPDRVGARYHLEARGSQRVKAEASARGTATRVNELFFSIELSADVSVLEVNAEGWATRKSFVVLNSTFINNGVNSPLLPAGTTVVALIRDGQTHYLVDEQTLDSPRTEALRLILSLHVAGVDDDDMYSPRELKRVGESWGVNIIAIRSLLNETGIKGNDPKIIGSSTLEGRRGNHLLIRHSLKVTNIILPAPKGFEPEDGEMRTEASGRYPIRPLDVEKAESNQLSIRTTSKGFVGGEKVETKLFTLIEAVAAYQLTRVRKR